MSKVKAPAWLILCIISLIAGLALGVTNALTEDPIAAQALADAAAARKTVFADAESFNELTVEEGAAVDNCFEAVSGGNVVGHVAQVTVKGYGGAIEITVGVASDGTITGIACGGSGFAETPGLGAKVKEPAFTDQFSGMAAPVELTKNGGEVDSVTSASRSSGAVCNGVNTVCDYVAGLN